MHTDHAIARTDLLVRRWSPDQASWVARRSGVLEPQEHHFGGLQVRPYAETVYEDCNMILLTGWTMMLDALVNGTVPALPFGTYAAIGVGTSTTAVSPSDTKLDGDTGAASTTSWYQACSSAPTLALASSPATLTFATTLSGTQANFSIQEFGVANAESAGSGTGVASLASVSASVKMLNRGLANMGNKQSGSVWSLTVVISFGTPTGAGTIS